MTLPPEQTTVDCENGISDSIRSAQEEAEAYLTKIDAEEENKKSSDDEILLAPPKLLQLPQSALQEKTHDLKARGQQLDLLLLKAESYSHFILENQKRSQLTSVVASSSRKRKSGTTPSPSGSSGKKARGAAGSSSREDLSQEHEHSVDNTGAFKQPKNLVGGTLMDYQLEGLRWLLSLWENGLSGILADEMGLGKTIQIVALIAYLREANTTGPFIIAAPLATLTNWLNEFKKWLPSCPVVLYHGSKQEREEIRKKQMKLSEEKSMNFPVVITSFEILMIDRPHLERHVWQYIILDEGHRIKNRNCRLVRELKSFRSVSRLLLTGTPIQNTLEELWSLLNFCSPNIFDDLEVFQSWFGFKNIGRDTQVDDIIGTERQEQVVTKLHEILRPFLLRRVKKDVLLKMPPKKEIVVYCGMSSLQREYYDLAVQNRLRDALMSMNIEGAKETSQMNVMMTLRKVCNHPFLFGEPRDDAGNYLGEANKKLLVMASGKFRLLDRMLPRLKKGGHKVLIFSQMTKLMDILEDYLLSLGDGYKYCRLDGSTKLADRQKSIDKFNKDPNMFAFLLSTRAGGLGINLTAADTCILFDSDWNPHQDSQAQDRCHRIGQKNPVLVYRLLTVGSVEIEMMEKQISKKKLERLTIHGGDYRKAGERASGHLTINRLRQLLDDDVKNLSRMTLNRTGHVRSALSLTDTAAASAAGSPSSDAPVTAEISDYELDLILDRTKIFRAYDEDKENSETASTTASASASGKSSASASTKSSVSSEDEDSVPTEGAMYDIIKVDTSGGVLAGLN